LKLVYVAHTKSVGGGRQRCARFAAGLGGVAGFQRRITLM
jgi:hypothetical protein